MDDTSKGMAWLLANVATWAALDEIIQVLVGLLSAFWFGIKIYEYFKSKNKPDDSGGTAASGVSKPASS